MRTASLRSIPLLLVLLVCCACSFRGSVGRADGTSSSSPSSEHTTGSSSSPTTSTAGASATTGAAGSTTPADGTPAGVDRCHTGELAGTLVPGGAGAGQRYATLVLRNTGDGACTVHGYGGLGLVDGDGHALPTRQVRREDPPATTVTLQPGDTVSAQLHWGAVAGPG